MGLKLREAVLDYSNSAILILVYFLESLWEISTILFHLPSLGKKVLQVVYLFSYLFIWKTYVPLPSQDDSQMKSILQNKVLNISMEQIKFEQ